MVVFVMAAIGLALAWGADDQRELERVARVNCQQIEALKAQFRDQAIQNYEHLAQNARILDIELTPELRREARRGRDQALRRFAEGDC